MSVTSAFSRFWTRREFAPKHVQSTGAIPTRFGVTVLSTSSYSCNFLRERRIEITFLPISSTVYFAPEELDFVSVRLKSFLVCPVKFEYRSGAISTAEILLSSAARFRRAYSWSLEDWYCCVRNRLLHTLVLVSVLCALLFLSCKRNKKVRLAGLFRRSRLPAQSLYTWSRNSPGLE